MYLRGFSEDYCNRRDAQRTRKEFIYLVVHVEHAVTLKQGLSAMILDGEREQVEVRLDYCQLITTSHAS